MIYWLLGKKLGEQAKFTEILTAVPEVRGIRSSLAPQGITLLWYKPAERKVEFVDSPQPRIDEGGLLKEILSPLHFVAIERATQLLHPERHDRKATLQQITYLVNLERQAIPSIMATAFEESVGNPTLSCGIPIDSTIGLFAAFALAGVKLGKNDAQERIPEMFFTNDLPIIAALSLTQPHPQARLPESCNFATMPGFATRYGFLRQGIQARWDHYTALWTRVWDNLKIEAHTA